MVSLVRVEGTLDELRELFGDAKRTVRSVRSASKEVAKTTQKVKRKLSAWQRYIANSKNHIKFKSGARKGRLDLKKMSRAFKKTKK